jgi:hypothetical protein
MILNPWNFALCAILPLSPFRWHTSFWGLKLTINHKNVDHTLSRNLYYWIHIWIKFLMVKLVNEAWKTRGAHELARTFYSQSSARKNFFVVCVKIIIFCASKLLFTWYSFVFLHMPQKISFHHKILWMNIDCSDVHLGIFVQMFWHFKCIFHNRCI